MTDYEQLSDQELVALLIEGNHAAFTAIYERYWALLFRHARRMLNDDEEAGDIVQEVFAYLWTKRNELYFRSSLTAYLYSAVRYKTLDMIKRSKVKDKYIVSLGKYRETEETGLDEDLIMKELAAKIEAGIAHLPKKMRAVFELSRKENLSHLQIARKLDITDSAVKKHITRAIKILRLRLELILISILLLFR